MVSSTSAGRWAVAEKALEALATCLPLRQADRAKVCRSIVYAPGSVQGKDDGWGVGSLRRVSCSPERISFDLSSVVEVV